MLGERGRESATGDRRTETGEPRHETGDRRQEVGEETGDRRQEVGEETGDRRKEKGDFEFASTATAAIPMSLSGVRRNDCTVRSNSTE